MSVSYENEITVNSKYQSVTLVDSVRNLKTHRTLVWFVTSAPHCTGGGGVIHNLHCVMHRSSATARPTALSAVLQTGGPPNCAALSCATSPLITTTFTTETPVFTTLCSGYDMVSSRLRDCNEPEQLLHTTL